MKMWKLERGVHRGRIKAEPFGGQPYFIAWVKTPGAPDYLGPDWGNTGPRTLATARSILEDWTRDRALSARLAPLLVERVLQHIHADEYFLTDAAVMEALEDQLSSEWMEKARL